MDHTSAVIVRAARHALIAGEPVDVGRVAAEVGVDRSTVFRRVGRRDRLIAEALWQTTATPPAPCGSSPPPQQPNQGRILALVR